MSRVSQLILLVPLGLFQLVAVIAFSVFDGFSGWDWPVAVWAVVMSASCAAVSVRLRRSAPWQYESTCRRRLGHGVATPEHRHGHRYRLNRP